MVCSVVGDYDEDYDPMGHSKEESDDDRESDQDKTWTYQTEEGETNHYSYTGLTAWQMFLKCCEWSVSKEGGDRIEIQSFNLKSRTYKKEIWTELLKFEKLNFKDGVMDGRMPPKKRPQNPGPDDLNPASYIPKKAEPVPHFEFKGSTPDPTHDSNPVPVPVPAPSTIPNLEKSDLEREGRDYVSSTPTFQHMLLIMLFYAQGKSGSQTPLGETKFEESRELLAKLMLVELFRKSPETAIQDKYKPDKTNKDKPFENLFEHYAKSNKS